MTNYLKYQGDDVALNLTFKDSAGVAINITGYIVYFTLKRNKFDAEASAVLSKDIIAHTDATTGQTQISLTSAETSVLRGSYYYDIRYKTGAGVKKVVDSGVITFREIISERS